MNYRAYATAIAINYAEYGYGWRFSAARSVTAATSARVQTGGDLGQRCHLSMES
ncbi:hypothetical protein ACLUEY_03630 [Vreelandella aquamarina]